MTSIGHGGAEICLFAHYGGEHIDKFYFKKEVHTCSLLARNISAIELFLTAREDKMFLHEADLNNTCFDQVFHIANQNIEFLWRE